MEISLLTSPQDMGKDIGPSTLTKSLGHLQPKVGMVFIKKVFFGEKQSSEFYYVNIKLIFITIFCSILLQRMFSLICTH